MKGFSLAPFSPYRLHRDAAVAPRVMPHIPSSTVLGDFQRCGGEGLRLSWLVVMEKVLLSLVVHGSKETMAKECETCFPLQAELAHCACGPKAVLLVSQKRHALTSRGQMEQHG